MSLQAHQSALVPGPLRDEHPKPGTARQRSPPNARNKVFRRSRLLVSRFYHHVLNSSPCGNCGVRPAHAPGTKPGESPMLRVFAFSFWNFFFFGLAYSRVVFAYYGPERVGPACPTTMGDYLWPTENVRLFGNPAFPGHPIIIISPLIVYLVYDTRSTVHNKQPDSDIFSPRCYMSFPQGICTIGRPLPRTNRQSQSGRLVLNSYIPRMFCRVGLVFLATTAEA
jgi:hypothetical protein